MLIYVSGFLTVVLVLNCALLILLVLMQLPKKDAGAGMAFGAGTADALFGAGSGNVMTKVTKWVAGIFLVLSMVLGMLMTHLHPKETGDDLVRNVQQLAAQDRAQAAQQQRPQGFQAQSLQTPATNVPAGAVTAPATPATKPAVPAAAPQVPATSGK